MSKYLRRLERAIIGGWVMWLTILFLIFDEIERQLFPDDYK